MQISKIENNTRIDEVKNLVEAHCGALGINYDSFEIEMSLEAIIKSPDSCVFILDDDKGEAKGYIIGTLSRNLVDGESMCVELGFYCSVPGKGSSLLENLEYWASSKGASLVCMTSHNDKEGKLDTYYARKGYTLKEKIYSKRID